jgi:IclR family acetate operon transcriptional repressor
MESLLTRFRETVNLGVLDGSEVLYVQVLESPEMFRMAARVGMRSALHSTAMGKALLAYLPLAEREKVLPHKLQSLTSRTLADRSILLKDLESVRARGYAVDSEEDSQGVRCVGAPILDGAHRVVAAMSVSAPAIRMPADRMQKIARKVSKACLDISRELGWRLVNAAAR